MTKNLMQQAMRMKSVLDSAKSGKGKKFKALSLSQTYMKYGKKPKMKSLVQMAKGISKKKMKSIWM